MSTGSNGFPYQVTHLVVLAVERIERRLEELHEQALGSDRAAGVGVMGFEPTTYSMS